MPGGFSITPRSDGTVLTAAIYNADRQEIVDNLEPDTLDDYSLNVSQMRSQVDPGEFGAESLPSNLAGEIERIRFRIAEISGQTYWSQTGTGVRAQGLASGSLPAAGLPGRLAYQTNNPTGLMVDTGGLWRAVSDLGAVNVRDFGAVGNGVADDTAAINLAKTYAAGIGSSLLFPFGTYNHTGLTFNTQGMRIIGIGQPVLNHTGTGRAVYFDGTGGAIYRCMADGITFAGNTNTTILLECAASHHFFARNLNFRDCDTALKLSWVVGGVWENITCSSNHAAFAIKAPNVGIHITQTAPGFYSTDNVFLNPTIEGVLGAGADTGIHIEHGSNNLFLSGTSEHNKQGIVIRDASSNNCYRNTFINMWFEDNSDYDVFDGGNNNNYINCYFGSIAVTFPNLFFDNDATGARVVGGYCRHVAADSTCRQLTFDSVAFNFTGSVGLRISGGANSVANWHNCYKVDNSAVYDSRIHDNIGQEGTFTPVLAGLTTGGTLTYSTQLGTYTRVGHLVFFSIRLVLTGITVAPAGGLFISGLPFFSDSDFGEQSISISQFSNINLALPVHLGAYVNPGQTTIILRESGDTAASIPLDAGSLATNSSIHLSGTYVAVHNN